MSAKGKLISKVLENLGVRSEKEAVDKIGQDSFDRQLRKLEWEAKGGAEAQADAGKSMGELSEDTYIPQRDIKTTATPWVQDTEARLADSADKQPSEIMSLEERIKSRDAERLAAADIEEAQAGKWQAGKEVSGKPLDPHAPLKEKQDTFNKTDVSPVESKRDYVPGATLAGAVGAGALAMRDGKQTEEGNWDTEEFEFNRKRILDNFRAAGVKPPGDEEIDRMAAEDMKRAATIRDRNKQDSARSAADKKERKENPSRLSLTESIGRVKPSTEKKIEEETVVGATSMESPKSLAARVAQKEADETLPPPPETVADIPGDTTKEKEKTLRDKVDELEKDFTALSKRSLVNTSSITEELTQARKDFEDAKTLNERLEAFQGLSHAFANLWAKSRGAAGGYTVPDLNLTGIDYDKRTGREKDLYGMKREEIESKRRDLEKTDKESYDRELDSLRGRKSIIDIESAAEREDSRDKKLEDRILKQQATIDIKEADKELKLLQEQEAASTAYINAILNGDKKSRKRAEDNIAKTGMSVETLQLKEDAADEGMLGKDKRRVEVIQTVHLAQLREKIAEARARREAARNLLSSGATAEQKPSKQGQPQQTKSPEVLIPRGYRRVSVDGKIYDVPEADVAAALKETNARLIE